MQNAVKYSKELVKHKLVKQISETLFEVEGNTIKLHKKPGRTLCTCSCKSHTLYCNESPICVHKLAVLLYISHKDFLERLDKLIVEYEKSEELKLPAHYYRMIEDLKDIRRKW